MYKPCVVQIALLIDEDRENESYEVRCKMDWQEDSEAKPLFITLDEEKAEAIIIAVARMGSWFEDMQPVLNGTNN